MNVAMCFFNFSIDSNYVKKKTIGITDKNIQFKTN